MTAQLLAALIAVESGGDCNAIGDNGRSIGCLQITEPCVRDVNRIYGTTFKWPDDCFNWYLSTRICDLYLSHYGGEKATDHKLARIWNAGPKGHRNPASRAYWRKVKQQLERQ